MGLRTTLRNSISRWLLSRPENRNAIIRGIAQDRTLLFHNAPDHGLIYFLDLTIGQSILLTGEYERKVVTDLRCFLEEKKLFKSNSMVLELGANIGTHSIYLERDFDASRVIALEPDPELFGILDRNIALNRLDGIIIPVQLAVSDQQGLVRFARDMSNRGGSGIGSRAETLGKDAPSIDVEATTVDDLLDRLDMSPSDIDLIWMDVESHELEVFRGMVEFLSIAKPPIFFEYTPSGDSGQRAELRDIVFGNYGSVYSYDGSFHQISPDDFDQISEMSDLLAIDV